MRSEIVHFAPYRIPMPDALSLEALAFCNEHKLSIRSAGPGFKKGGEWWGWWNFELRRDARRFVEKFGAK